MSRVMQFRFGPGSLESTALRMWAVQRRHVSHTRAVKAEVVGTYRVYCGQGWEHTVDIDEEFAFDIEHPPDELSRRLAKVWNSGDPDVATDVAHLLVERVLQDWSDPCDVTGDEL